MDTIIEQAESTFIKNITDETFSDSLNELVRRINAVHVTDLNFNLDSLEMFKSENAKEIYPPVTCIDVKESPAFTMEIFILQEGSRIPLHDHPEMHGILKVIYGSVKYTSYTPKSCVRNEIEIPQDIKNAVRSGQLDSLIPVEEHTKTVATYTDQPYLLTPTEGNYHEICAVGGTAAVFDLLAPPYGERDCHYYSVLETKTSDSECRVWLSEKTEEPTYWCE